MTDASGQQTFQSWDTIDGGAGVNTLNAQNALLSPVLTPSLANIQILNFQDTLGTDITLNMQGLSTLTNLNLEGAGAASAYVATNLGSVPKISLSGMAAASTLNFTSAALQPAGQVLELTLNGFTAAGGKAAAGLTLSDTGSNTLETISIIASGSASNVGNLTTTNLGVTTLNVSGNQNITFTVNDATTGAPTLKTINASTLTGQLNVITAVNSTVTGGEGNDTMTAGAGGFLSNFSGGLGNDTFVMGTNLNANTTVAGGDGTGDILSADGATLVLFTAAAPTTNVSGIESVTVSATGVAAGTTLLLSAIQSGIADVNLQASANNAGSITFDAGVAGNIDVGGGAGAATDDVAGLTVAVAGTGTTDSVTIDNDTAAVDILSTGGVAGTLTFNGVETVTIDGTTTGAKAVAQNTAGIAMTASPGGTTTLKLIGNNDFVTSGALAAGTVDASGLGTTAAGVAAILDMTLGLGSALTSSIIGGGGNDILLAGATKATNIAGGAGADTITGSTGNDTLSGEAGNDSITAGTGNDSIDAGAGNDIVVMAGNLTNADTVAGGDGIDTLNTSNAITAAIAANVSGFETLQADAAIAQDMAVLAAGNAVTTFEDNSAAGGSSLTNASAAFNSLVVSSLTVGPGATFAMSRLVDGAADTLNITREQDPAAPAATGYDTTLTLQDEDTINIVTSDGVAADNLFTIGTIGASGLLAKDAATITVTGNDSVLIVLDTDGFGTSGATTVDLSGVVNDALALTVTFDGSLQNDVSVGMTINGSTVEDNGLIGGAGNDSITGGSGADTLAGSGGADTINGGSGTDTYSAVGMNLRDDGAVLTGGGVVINLGSATLTAVAINTATGGMDTAGATTSVASNQVAYLDTTGAGGVGMSANKTSLSSIENLIGSGGDDYIVGSSTANNIDGDTGNDTIVGGAGGDTITVGTGNNVVSYTSTTTAGLTAEGRDILVDFLTAPNVDVLSFASLVGLTGFVAGTAAGVGEVLIAAVSGAAGDVNLVNNATGASVSAEATFVYNTVTNVLTFDADGTGAAASAITIATLPVGVAGLLATDFIVA